MTLQGSRARAATTPGESAKSGGIIEWGQINDRHRESSSSCVVNWVFSWGNGVFMFEVIWVVAVVALAISPFVIWYKMSKRENEAWAEFKESCERWAKLCREQRSELGELDRQIKTLFEALDHLQNSDTELEEFLEKKYKIDIRGGKFL